VAEKIHRNALKPGYRLHWYEITSVLGQGGFGITYLAHDTNLDKAVALKEYLPIELATRERDSTVQPITDDRAQNYQWGLQRFITEARTLSRFSHPNIVRVHAVFEENNTAYMVMEYEHGESLQHILSRHQKLEEAELLSLLLPIIGGLDLVHQAGFIHRDIKPANIFIRQDGNPVLLDFGSARQALGEQTKTLTSLVSPGYAPFEQYYSKGEAQGPWTDIYGLGATLYRAVAGRAPLDAVDRSKAVLEGSKDLFVSALEIGKGRYSERFLRAIDHALKFKPEERPQTLSQWKTEFGVAEDIAEIKRLQIQEEAITQPGIRVLSRPSRQLRPATFALLTILIASAVVFYYQEPIRGLLEPSPPETTTPEVTEQIPSPEEIALAEREAELAGQKAEEEAAQRQHEEEINQLLAQAEQAFAAGQYLEPPGNNALDAYLKVLDLNPENITARKGKQQIFDHFLQKAYTLMEAQRFDAAERTLLKADIVEADSRAVKLARLRLEEKRAEATRLAEEEARRRQTEEQRRKEEEEAKRLAELEKQKQEEERKRLEEQKRLEEERKQQEEEARLAELEQLRQEEAKRKAEEERKQKYNLLIAEAGQAVSNRNKELAIKKYKDALDLYPDDQIALNGLKEAEQLIDKRCLDAVVGIWEPKSLLAGHMVIKSDGTANRWVREPELITKWECIDPSIPVIRMEDKYAISELTPLSNGCLEGKTDFNKDGIWSKPYTCWLKKSEVSSENTGTQTIQSMENTEASTSKENIQTPQEGENVCAQIIGAWKWNDLGGTVSRFYANGKVVSGNIIKSEGTWECIDPENRFFTFNTWNKKREIQMNEDYNNIQSVGPLLREKISANKISDNPSEKIAPTQKSHPENIGL